MNKLIRMTLLGTLFMLTGVGICAAADYHCEVLNLRGKVTATAADGTVRSLKEGDLVAAGELVEAGMMSSADLAFDKDWKNIARVESYSKMKVTEVFPTKLELKEGGVFAKLKGLPKDSAFEVQTPTAVASVRGTEYRTVFKDGQTQVFNVSPSKVYVNGIRKDGSVNREDEVVLEQSKKIQVEDVDQPLGAPEEMTGEEAVVTEIFKKDIDKNVEAAVASGRVSEIQSVSQLEEDLQKMKAGASEEHLEPNTTEESRVVDLRRRPFKKIEG